MSVDAATIIAELGVRLATIPGLRVYPFRADKPEPPAAVVGLGAIVYDATKGRGSDRVAYTIMILVGKVSDRASMAKLAEFARPGPSSIKAAVDGNLPSGGGPVRVVGMREPDVVTWNAVDYLGATFDVEVID